MVNVRLQANLLLETTLNLPHHASRNSVRYMVSNMLQPVLTIRKQTGLSKGTLTCRR
jgi:hypothetical protein